MKEMSKLEYEFIAEVESHPILYSGEDNTYLNNVHTNCSYIWKQIAAKFKIGNGLKAFEAWLLLVERYKRFLKDSTTYFEYAEAMSFLQEHLFEKKTLNDGLPSPSFDDLQNTLNNIENSKFEGLECYEEPIVVEDGVVESPEICEDTHFDESYIIYEEVETFPKKQKLTNQESPSGDEQQCLEEPIAFPITTRANVTQPTHSLPFIRKIVHLPKTIVDISADNYSQYEAINTNQTVTESNFYTNVQSIQKDTFCHNIQHPQSYPKTITIPVKNITPIQIESVATNNVPNSLHISAAYQLQGTRQIKAALNIFRENCYKAITHHDGFQSLTESIDEFSKEILRINNRPLPIQQITDATKDTSTFTNAVNNFNSTELIFLGYAKALTKMSVPLQMKFRRQIAEIMENAEMEAYQAIQNERSLDNITHIEI